MTLNEFLYMDLLEQERYLNDHGTLQSYIDKENRLYLYQLDSFYVEAEYVYKPEYKVIRIDAWEDIGKIDPYLDTMDISKYVSHPGIRGSNESLK